MCRAHRELSTFHTGDSISIFYVLDLNTAPFRFVPHVKLVRLLHARLREERKLHNAGRDNEERSGGLSARS